MLFVIKNKDAMAFGRAHAAILAIALTAVRQPGMPNCEHGRCAADTMLSGRSTSFIYEFINTFNVIRTSRHASVNKML